ncbi:unnamed protein product [Trifolium pratense]|uniref:Uncharacterized protein n=1 Tax=Trifolium pratense TaxID=57577 RepID=A0ACB0J2W4_TRIPR|nr:unnamed protein product [Trifolium pratense]
MSNIFTPCGRTLFMPQKRMSSIRAFHDIDMENLNAEVDHRRSGCMTAIDDQGPCGSCWAIATVSAARKLKTGILEKLSAKELIDRVEGCDGRKGGKIYVALDYIQRRDVSLYGHYPLHPWRMQGECIVKSSNRKLYISGYKELICNPQPYIHQTHLQQPVIATIVVGDEYEYKTGNGILILVPGYIYFLLDLFTMHSSCILQRCRG